MSDLLIGFRALDLSKELIADCSRRRDSLGAEELGGDLCTLNKVASNSRALKTGFRFASDG